MRIKPLIIGSVIVAALVAGIVVLLFLPESGSEPHPTVPPPSSDFFVFLEEAPDDVTGIHFIPKSGISYTLLRDAPTGEIKLDSDELVFDALPFLPDIIFFSAISLTHQALITGDADDAQLLLFGLIDPEMTWRIYRTNNTSVMVMAGAQPATGGGRYVRLENSREVFLLNEQQSLLLTRELEDLYDISFLPPFINPDDEASFAAIEHIVIETDNSITEVRRRTHEELAAAAPGSSVYRIIRPFAADANDYIIETVILGNVSRIYPASIEAIKPADLTEFGLDKPDTLTVTVGDWTGILLIGRRSTEREGRYVMIEGHDAVLFDPNGIYTFLQAAPEQIRSQIIWLHMITDVSSVIYKLDGENHVLELEHGDNRRVSGRLDDRDISEAEARMLFLAALGIVHSGFTDSAVPAEPPTYSIIISLIDGSSDTLDLYRLNETQFLIVRNGINTGFFITRMSLQQTLLSSFDAMDN